MIEQTLVLIKPDGVQKKLIGRIISRFEEADLRLAGMKMIWPDEKMARKHYPLDEEWAKSIYKKSKEASEKNSEPFPFKDYLDIGKFVQEGLVNFIMESPIVAIVMEGPHAIELIRKIIGSTEPRQSLPGTIRGDFASVESYFSANSKGRAVRNLIHASDSVENAEKEIAIWFSKGEVHDYSRPGDEHAFGKKK